MRFTLGNFREDDSDLQKSDLIDFLKTLRGEISYQDTSTCKKNILNVDQSIESGPTLRDLLTIRKILDGRLQQNYIECVDEIYPEKELGLEMVWEDSTEQSTNSLYYNTQILKVRNFYKPTHSNFENLNSYSNWSTLYFSDEIDTHTISDDMWSPVYIHPANISRTIYSDFPDGVAFDLQNPVNFNEIDGYQLYIENRPVYILNPLIERSLQNTNTYYNEHKSHIVKQILESSDFYFKWEGKNPSGELLAKLPLVESGEYDTKVYWGDGTAGKFDSIASSETHHLYTLELQERNIVLRGNIKNISFEENDEAYEASLTRSKLQSGQNLMVGCSDEKRHCKDGTLVSRNPNNNCAFYDCPEKLSIMHSSSDECFFLIGDDIENNLNFKNTPRSTTSSHEISFGDEYLSWKVNYISDENSEYSEFQMNQFKLALERWSGVIKMNHQIEIDVNLVYEEESDIIAFANTTHINQNGLAVGGQITWNTKFLSQNFSLTGTPFDESFYDANNEYTEMYAVTLHEIGHVLGIGTRFNLDSNKMFVHNGTTGEVLPFNYRSEYYNEDSEFWENLNPVYKGKHAVNAYNRITGLNYDALPIEDSGGVATRGAHLEEGIDTNFESQIRNYIYNGNEVKLPYMQFELMSGWHDYGGLPLSEITIGMLHDLGYTVDYSHADEYSIEGYPNNTPTPTITFYADDFACTRDVKVCRDGSYVSRDAENNCEFPSCQQEDDDIIRNTSVPSYAHNKLIEIMQWGSLNLSESNFVFKNCRSLKKISATDSPVFSFDLNYMFKDCVNLTSVNVDAWNTENVVSMQGMFMNCASLDCNLNNLNTKKVLFS